MNRRELLSEVRRSLAVGNLSIGSWMQIPHPSIAEILGKAGYDWVAVDMEHGSIGVHQLPDLFRALELGGTLPLARLLEGSPRECKQALDAGAGGVIAPMVESAEQLSLIRDACRWPPAGTRGVGFSRANLFGEYFNEYRDEAQAPLLVAMIEHVRAVQNLKSILTVTGLDAILIGPYDLSASMEVTGQFQEPEFTAVMGNILARCLEANIPCGIHVIAPDPQELEQRVTEGYRFIAYATDAIFLRTCACRKTLSWCAR